MFGEVLLKGYPANLEHKLMPALILWGDFAGDHPIHAIE